MKSVSSAEIEEFNELFYSIDMSELSLRDSLILAEAYCEMVEKVKPVLLRHLASRNQPQSFLFKL